MSNEGEFDLSNLLAQAQAMQQQVQEAQEQQANQLVTGTAAGGKVAVEASGAGEFRSVKLSPDVVDPSDVEMLEDLVLAAVRDAADQIADIQAGSLDNIQIPDLGSMGGGLGDLLGPGGQIEQPE